MRFLSQTGILAKYGIELIGAKLPSIDRAEDRELFKQAMYRIGLKCAPSGMQTCNSADGGDGGPLDASNPAQALQINHSS